MSGRYIGPLAKRLGSNPEASSLQISRVRIFVEQMLQDMEAFGRMVDVRREPLGDGCSAIIHITRHVEGAPIIRIDIDCKKDNEETKEEEREPERILIPDRFSPGLFVVGGFYYIEPNPEAEFKNEDVIGSAGSWKLVETNHLFDMAGGYYIQGVVTDYCTVGTYWRWAKNGVVGPPYAFLPNPPEEFVEEFGTTGFRPPLTPEDAELSTTPIYGERIPLYVRGPTVDGGMSEATYFLFSGKDLVCIDPGLDTYHVFDGVDANGRPRWSSSDIEYPEDAAQGWRVQPPLLVASRNVGIAKSGRAISTYSGCLFDAAYGYSVGYLDFNLGHTCEVDEYVEPAWPKMGWPEAKTEGDLDPIRYFFPLIAPVGADLPDGTQFTDGCLVANKWNDIIYNKCCYIQLVGKKTIGRNGSFSLGPDQWARLRWVRREETEQLTYQRSIDQESSTEEEREWLGLGYPNNTQIIGEGYFSCDRRTVLSSEVINGMWVMDIDCNGYIVTDTQLHHKERNSYVYVIDLTTGLGLGDLHRNMNAETGYQDYTMECLHGNYTTTHENFITNIPEPQRPGFLNPPLFGERIDHGSFENGGAPQTRKYLCSLDLGLNGVLDAWASQVPPAYTLGNPTDCYYEINGVRIQEQPKACAWWMEYQTDYLGFEPLSLSGMTEKHPDGTLLSGALSTHTLGGCLLSPVTVDGCAIFATFAVRSGARGLEGGVPFSSFDEDSLNEAYTMYWETQYYEGPETHETFEVWGVYKGEVTNLTSLLDKIDGMLDLLKQRAFVATSWNTYYTKYDQPNMGLFMPMIATRIDASEAPVMLDSGFTYEQFI